MINRRTQARKLESATFIVKNNSRLLAIMPETSKILTNEIPGLNIWKINNNTHFPEEVINEKFARTNHLVICKEGLCGSKKAQFLNIACDRKLRSIFVANTNEDFKDYLTRFARTPEKKKKIRVEVLPREKFILDGYTDGHSILVPSTFLHRGNLKGYGTLRELVNNTVRIEDYGLPSIIAASKYLGKIKETFPNTSIYILAAAIRYWNQRSLPVIPDNVNVGVYEFVFHYLRDNEITGSSTEVALYLLPELRKYFKSPKSDVQFVRQIVIMIQYLVGAGAVKSKIIVGDFPQEN